MQSDCKILFSSTLCRVKKYHAFFFSIRLRFYVFACKQRPDTRPGECLTREWNARGISALARADGGGKKKNSFIEKGWSEAWNFFGEILSRVIGSEKLFRLMARQFRGTRHCSRGIVVKIVLLLGGRRINAKNSVFRSWRVENSRWNRSQRDWQNSSIEKLFGNFWRAFSFF